MRIFFYGVFLAGLIFVGWQGAKLASDGPEMFGGFGSEVDETGAQVTVDYTHHQIHEGEHHFICSYDTLASGASTTFTVRPMTANGDIHMLFEVESSNILEVEVYEGGATTTAGTSATPLNSNRSNYSTSTLMVAKDAFISGHTLLYEQKYGANGQFTKFGGSANRENEMILRNNTVYYYKFISGAADNIVSYCGEWYEQD